MHTCCSLNPSLTGECTSATVVDVLQYAAFEDEVGIYLVTEYASRGDVFGELDRRGGSMTESDAVRQVRH